MEPVLAAFAVIYGGAYVLFDVKMALDFKKDAKEKKDLAAKLASELSEKDDKKLEELANLGPDLIKQYYPVGPFSYWAKRKYSREKSLDM